MSIIELPLIVYPTGLSRKDPCGRLLRMTATSMAGSRLDRLFKAGGHFAQRKHRRHPSMKPYIVGSASRFEIFDLAKTDGQIDAAKAFITALAKAGKVVLFVGGKKEIADIVRDSARRIGVPYVASRWLGGTMTNFLEIKKRIDRLADLNQKKESGELAKLYTKLERVFIDREIARLTSRLDGLQDLARRPDALVIVDTRADAHAAREARTLGIPVVGIMSSDCDLSDATYPIVVNDASRASVSLVLSELAHAYEEGKKG